MSATSPEPWKSGVRSYAGWVPNVRSHLSFSRIGAGRGAESYTVPLRDGSSRLVLVFQRRATNDFPLHSELVKRLFADIKVEWFLDAETESTDLPIWEKGATEVKTETDRQGMLAGSIYLMPRQWTPRQRAVAREVRNEITHLFRSKRSRKDLTPQEYRAKVVEKVTDHGFTIRLSFALMRTGECRIWFDGRAGTLDDFDHDCVAEQAYFFLKDVAHDHAHHDPSDDQITPLVLFHPRVSQKGHDPDIAWRRETMWSLSREIERRNRNEGLVGQRQSLGIIAYAEAFQDTLMTHVRDATAKSGYAPTSEIHNFDFKYLKDSVKASIDVAGTKLGQRVQMAIAFTATLISSIALVSSLVSTYNAVLPRPSFMAPTGALQLGGGETIIPLMAGSPLLVGLGVAAALLGLISFFFADGSSGLFNRLQRTYSQLMRAVAVTLFEDPRKHFLFMLFTHFASASFLFAAVLGVSVFVVGRLL